MKRIVWIPLLLIAAALYWSTALSLGSRSLGCHDSDDVVFVPEPEIEPPRGILVRLVSPSDVEEVRPAVAPARITPHPADQDVIGRTSY